LARRLVAERGFQPHQQSSDSLILLLTFLLVRNPG
jgi:hypothetical protein